jgi:hypothetical protein
LFLELVVQGSKLSNFVVLLLLSEKNVEVVMFDLELLINGGFTMVFFGFELVLYVKVLPISNGSNSSELTLDKLEFKS